MTPAIDTLRQALRELDARRAAGAIDAAAHAAAKADLERRLLDAVLASDEPVPASASASASAPTLAPASASASAAAATSVSGAAVTGASRVGVAATDGSSPGAASPGPVPTAAASSGGAIAGAAPSSAVAAPRPSAKLLTVTAALVVATAVGGYAWRGSPELPSAGAPGAVAAAGHAGDDAPDADNEARFAAAVEQLALKLREQPDNGDGFAMLARSYARLGRHTDAVPAFERAVALQPRDARLLADFADSVAMANGRRLEGRPTQLVEQALTIDPDHAKALALAGTAAFNRGDFAAAVAHWERLQRNSPPDGAFLPQLLSSIDEARQRAGLPPRTAAARAPDSAAPTGPAAPRANAPAPAATAAVSGRVRLAPALAARVAPDDTVFVLVRPADGSRMPLAVLRRQVRDLPFDFRLDDAMAMSPAARLSMHPRVVVVARVSRSGQAAPAPGDLAGQSPPVANDAAGVDIEIAGEGGR